MATATIGQRVSVTLPAPSGEFRASPLSIWSALVAVYLIWGSTYLAIRYAVETTAPSSGRCRANGY
jgi:hypothetical protein